MGKRVYLNVSSFASSAAAGNFFRRLVHKMQEVCIMSSLICKSMFWLTLMHSKRLF